MANGNEIRPSAYGVDCRFIPRGLRGRTDFSDRWAVFCRFSEKVKAENALRRIRSALGFGAYGERLMLVDRLSRLEPTPDGEFDVRVMFDVDGVPVGTSHDAWCVMCDRRRHCQEIHAMAEIKRWLDQAIALLDNGSGPGLGGMRSLSDAMRLANTAVGGMGGSVLATFTLAPVAILCASPATLREGVAS